MNVEEIIREVQEETEAYLAKLQALQYKMPAGFYFQVPKIEIYTPLGSEPLFILEGIDIERKIL